MANLRNVFDNGLAPMEDEHQTLDRIGPNKDMRVFIPTYKRVKKQKTLGFFSEAKINCTLVVRAEEEKEYKTAYPSADMLVIPAESKVDDIGKTRQFILDWAHANTIKYICMADDDLTLNVRGKNNKQSDKVEPSDTVKLFGQQLQWLDEGIIHCGLASSSVYQEKKFREPSMKFIENTKLFCFISMNVGKVFEAGAKYRLSLVEDYDFTLQLLTKQHKNRISVEFNFTPGTGKQGGCFTYRNSANHTKALEELARLHNVDGKNIVSLKEKKSKSRPDEVMGAYIRWKAAFEGDVKVKGKRKKPETTDSKDEQVRKRAKKETTLGKPANSLTHNGLFSPAAANGAGAGVNTNTFTFKASH